MEYNLLLDLSIRLTTWAVRALGRLRVVPCNAFMDHSLGYTCKLPRGALLRGSRPRQGTIRPMRGWFDMMNLGAVSASGYATHICDFLMSSKTSSWMIPG